MAVSSGSRLRGWPALNPGLLVASPQMRDSNFDHSVVLLVSHGPDGSLGVVVNRETQQRMVDVVSGLAVKSGLPPTNASRPALWGGPVEPGTGFVLWRGSGPEGWSLGAYSLSQSRDRLRALVAAGDDFWLCLGYAGWGPGQLERELTEGSWIALEEGVEQVLGAPVHERYDAALRLLGVDPRILWMTPVDE